MARKILNFNIGVLGHIDSGKTTLAKALSSLASTASFDKSPQSKERGITIDLGFSSFCVEYPHHLKSVDSSYEALQFTLVDCPGHASLIRTIIGGAQIIDMMLLVVDATKGIQTQTAECLVIGEITCEHLLIIINKIDLLPVEKRPAMISKVMKKIAKALEKTKFSDAPMIPVAANPGGSTEKLAESIGTDDLVKTLTNLTYIPSRSSDGPFVFAVDHCFGIKGQGTVMTGTVIQGAVSVSDSIEIPSAKLVRKVKSIQMFKAPIEKATQGDRVGICLTQFDPKLLERGMACMPGHMQFVDAAIAIVEKIPYFKGSCESNAKFHLSIMHGTVMAKCIFFGILQTDSEVKNHELNSGNGCFDYDKEFVYLNELESSKTEEPGPVCPVVVQYALLQFDKPVIASKRSMLIGSKLDMDIHSNVCRLAFHGKIVTLFSNKQQIKASLPNLKIYKLKCKEGVVERIVNEYEVIVTDLFKKETKIQLFLNLKVSLSTGEMGHIEGSFGQSGKVKVRLRDKLSEDVVKHITKKKGKKEGANRVEVEQIKVFLKFKRYIYDQEKRIIQV